jgi:hypothetical protein
MFAIGAHSIRGKPANSRRTFDEEEILAALMAVLRESSCDCGLSAIRPFERQGTN